MPGLKKILIGISLFVVVLLLAFSFKSKSYSWDELGNYLKNPANGLMQTKVAGDKVVEMIYQPPQYMMAGFEKGNGVDSILSEYSKVHNFILRIQENENIAVSQRIIPQSAENHGLKQRYLGFGLKDALRLVNGIDTLNCSQYHLERNYGLTPYCSIIIGFPRNELKSDDLEILLQDDFLGIGNLEFIFKKNDVQRAMDLTVER